MVRPYLNCERSEDEIPLVALHYAGQPAWICIGCLPILIHHPQRVAGKLARTDTAPTSSRE